MSRRCLVCFLLLCGAMPTACRTSVQLADPPMTAPAAGVVGNRPPSVKIEGVSARVSAGTRLTLRGNVYDPDGDEVTLQWTATAGTLGGGSTARTTWTAPSAPMSLTITLRATDSSGASSADTVSVEVLAKP
jgi:PKD domain